MDEMKYLLTLDLQFFAKEGPGGEKTEEPTDKKLTDARKEGQVAKSKELGNSVSLIALFLVLKYGVGYLATQFLETFHMIYNKIPDYATFTEGTLSSKDFSGLIGQVIVRMIIMLLPVFLIGIVVAFLCDIVQVKWKPTSKPLKPKFNKLDPIKGAKRLFSKDKLMELFQSIIKIGIIVYVVYNTLKEEIGVIYLLYDIPLTQAILTVGNIAINLGLKISIIYLILGLADFAYQKW
jgi:flagellar biosynthetic protein FlhB